MYGGCRDTAELSRGFCKAHRQQREKEKAAKPKPEYSKWYHRFPYTGPHGLRYVTLAKWPICGICHHYPSTIADHIIPHKGNWALFVDLVNLMGVCKRCHDIKTATEDGGGGNPPGNPGGVVMTGDKGKQYSSTSVGTKAIDVALNREDD